eukprot:10871998-Ditylum_brightwellii.AAC.1
MVIVEVFNSSSGYQAFNIHSYNVMDDKPYLTGYYLNEVYEQSIASDGCISSSPNGPCSLHIHNLNMSLIPKELPSIYSMKDAVINNDSICPLPPFYKSNHIKREKTMAIAGAWVIQSVLDE